MSLKYLNELQDLSFTALLIRRTSSTLSLWCEEYQFKPRNISFTYARILTVLHDQTMSFTELVEVSVMPSYTISRAINRMVDDGLLIKKKDSRDKRKTFITATDKGLELRKTIVECVKNTGDALLNHLSEEELATLHKLLHSILENVAKKYHGFRI